MPYIDQIVMSLLALGLVGSLACQWRAGQRRGRLAAAVVGLFYGITLVVMLAAHCADVLWGLAHHATSMAGGRFTYDWRTYSLLLFGIVLIGRGVRCMNASLRMGRGDAAGRTALLREGVIVLALVLPLIPVHAFFGYLMSGATATTLVAVALGHSASPS